MSKYMIRCDIEGISGVVSYRQAEPGNDEYVYGQEWFMAELLALIEGLQAGGAEQIVIYDEHYYGRNIDIDRLPTGVGAICGKPPYRPDWAGGLDASFAGMIMLGFHAMYGDTNSLLHHSYELDIAELRLNGLAVGEIGNEAAIAGDWGVPTVMVTGDSAGVAEAEKLIDNVVGVSVKQSLGPEGALCYPLVDNLKKIRAAAEQVVKHPPKVKPLQIDGPVTLEVQLNDGAYLAAMQQLHADKMTDKTTLALTADTATATWAAYWQIKLQCQATMENNA